MARLTGPGWADFAVDHRNRPITMNRRLFLLMLEPRRLSRLANGGVPQPRRAGYALAPALLVLMLASCGGGSSSPTAPSGTPTPTPASTTFTLRGQVTEAPPFTTSPIVGAKVEFVDGANAGKSALTDASGNYTITNANKGGYTVRASADGYQPLAVGVTLAGDLTQNMQLATNGPRTTFGPGQYRVNSEIAAGRYFAAPSSGCYFERESGFGGTLDEIIANEFIGFNAGQWIVDVKSSDVGFKTDADCNTWYNTPREGMQSAIQPGMWLVGSQVQPGTYRATATSGCYWERLRNFSNTIGGVVANDFVSSDGVQRVTIRSGDVGFDSDEDCGVWTREASAASLANDNEQSRASVEEQWNRHRHSNGVQR